MIKRPLFQADKERNKALEEAKFWRRKFEQEARTKKKVQTSVVALKRRVKSLEDKSGKVRPSQVKKILLQELGPFFSTTQIMAFLRKKKSWTRIHGWTSADFSMALTLHMLSPKCYRHLQRNNILPLPGPTTLKSYVKRFQIQEGLLDNVVEFLRAKIATMSEKDRIVGLMFDEVHLKQTIEYDKATDSIIGPHTSSNVMLVRGIGGKSWKMPIWWKFGYALTKEEYLNIVSKLTEIGLHVVVSTCDMGPANRGLAKSLGVTRDKPFVDHPDHPGVKVWWLYDPPHLLKLLRLHFLKSGFRLQSGTVINRDMLLAIHAATRNSDITAGHHLTEGHIYVQRQDQQSVKKAAQVFSWRTASLIRLLAPAIAPDPSKNNALIELSNFVALTDKWFDAMNSQNKLDRKEMRCGLRVHHDKQVACLEDFYREIDGLRVVGKSSPMPWQVGICHTVKSLLLLYAHLREVHGLDYILTRRLNQDLLEHSFSTIRGMGGPCNTPGSLDFKRRLRLMILSGINKVVVQGSVVCCGLDNEVTVLTLDDLLNGFHKLEQEATAMTSDPPVIGDNAGDPGILKDAAKAVPSSPREIAIEEGIKYVSGFLLRRAGWEEKMVKDKDANINKEDIVESKWIDSLNTGGLSYPARSIVTDVKHMDAHFARFHKEAADGLMRQKNITKDFADLLAKVFPDYPLKFLEQFAFARTMFRLRQMKLDLAGSKESARSKKKCIDFAY